jgi:ribosomal protein S4
MVYLIWRPLDEWPGHGHGDIAVHGGRRTSPQYVVHDWDTIPVDQYNNQNASRMMYREVQRGGHIGEAMEND